MITLPHLETDVTTACQLSCVGCNHHVPLWRARGPQHASPTQVALDLTRLARVLHTPRWGALGGEPLLHPQLLDVLQAARDSGVADQTEVWTNGLRLPAMPDAFWRAFDILVLSVYPGKHTDDSLAWITQRCTDAGVRLDVKDERAKPNFRTLFEPTATDEPTTLAKYHNCFFRRFSRVANDGWFYTCCCAPHMPVLVQGRAVGSDGIPITPDLSSADIDRYLSSPSPLGACTICAGRETAQPLTWHEQRDPVRWLAASAGAGIE